MYDVLDVAKYVLYYARKHDYGMSVLQLMKILYFVQAQFLVSKKKRAFPDDIVALDWGPMERKVWAKYGVYGNANIPVLLGANFAEEEKIYTNAVAKIYTEDAFKNTYRIEVDTDSQRYKSVDGILYSKDGKSLLKCPTKRTGKVIIPNGVTEIRACAFEGSEVESVTFPDSLKIIESHAFRNCLYLKNVDFGNGITQIGDSNEKDIRSFGYLFEACENLKSVSIPEQVEIIGYAAFSKSGIETVELPAGIKKICECAFDRCNIRRISLPAAVELGRDAISEVSEIHVEDGEHLPHGIIQSMSKYNGLAKYITPDSNLVVKITQGNKTTYIPKDFSGMHTTIDTDNPSMDDLLTFFHKNHVRILRFLIRSNAAKDFCNALSISDCSNEELLRLLSATNDKSTVIQAYILDALSTGGKIAANFDNSLTL